jgi:O-antigen ligase
MIKSDYAYGHISGYKVIFLIFCLFLNIRLLTELPRMVRDVGWVNNDMSNYDLNRSISLILLAFCVFGIAAKRKIIASALLTQIILFLTIFFFLSGLLASYNFIKLGMPLTGILVVLSRFMMELVLIVFVLNFIRSRSDLDDLFTYFFKPAIFVIFIIAYLQIFTKSYADVQGIFRVTGPFGSPTTLAGFLHLFIALTCYYWRSKSLNFWIIVGLQYLLLFFTGSIASIAANLMFLMLIALKQRWYKLKLFYLMLPVVVSAGIISAIYKWESILQRVATLVNTQNFRLPEGSSVKWRFDAWGHYIDLLGDSVVNWLFGLGLGTQRWILHPEYENSLSYIFDAPGTHNDYLTVLVDFGIVGLLIFIFLAWLINRTIRDAEAYDPKLYFLKFYFYTIFLLMLSENYVDQLIMFVFIVFLVAVIKVAGLKRAEDFPMISGDFSNEGKKNFY